MLTRSLNCRSRLDTNNKRKYAGLSETGLSIRNAIHKVHRGINICRRVIVHVGAYDILVGRDAFSIKGDLKNLMNAFHKRGIDPIICTISPIANKAFCKTHRGTWEDVNDFICAQEDWCVLDLDNVLRLEDNRINFDLFIPYSVPINGQNQFTISLWNRTGRDMVLAYIEDVIMAFDSENFN